MKQMLYENLSLAETIVEAIQPSFAENIFTNMGFSS